MSEPKEFEIPDTVRKLTETSVEQARQAYNQVLEATRKTQDMVARSSDAMATAFRDVQAQTLRYTEQNMQANFALAAELARARDLKEAFEIQSRFARTQMETYASQAKEITRLMSEAAQRVQPNT